jgi:hypothetical protein
LRLMLQIIHFRWETLMLLAFITGNATNLSGGALLGLSTYNLLTVIGVLGAFFVSVVALLYSRSATKQSKRLSDATEKALELQKNELELHKSELEFNRRRFLSNERKQKSENRSSNSKD